MNKCFITIFIDDEVDNCGKNPISSDDLGDNEFPKAIALLIPLSWEGFFFWCSCHIPFLPFFCVVDKGSNNVGEIG